MNPAKLVGVALIIIGIAELPRWYYVAAKFAVAAICIYLALKEDEKRTAWISMAWIVVGISYPLVSYFLNILYKTTSFDYFMALVFVASSFYDVFISSKASVEPVEAIKRSSYDNHIEDYRPSLYDGFLDAGESKASLQVLEAKLNIIAGDHKAQEENIKEDYKKEISDRMANNEPLEKMIGRVEKEIEEKRKEIEDLNGQINEIATGERGGKYQFENLDEFDPVAFYVGSAILVFLTLYLFLFYSSATYSALFKDITKELTGYDSQAELSILFNSIFDPYALTKSFNINMAQFSFITLATVIFIAMGFLVYLYSTPATGKMEKEEKERETSLRRLKLLAITLVTFMLDSLLAYKITQNLYEAKFITGFTAEPWRFSMIFDDVNFYLVIACGFLIYIIWGVVFNAVVKQIRNKNPLKLAIRNRKNKIDIITKAIQNLAISKQEKEDQLTVNRNAITERQNRLNHMIFAKTILQKEFDKYYKRWVDYINGLGGNDVRKKEQGAEGVLNKVKMSYGLREK